METRRFLKGLCSAEQFCDPLSIDAAEALAWTSARTVPFSHLSSYPESEPRILRSKGPKGSADLRVGLVSVLAKELVIVSATSFIHSI